MDLFCHSSSIILRDSPFSFKAFLFFELFALLTPPSFFYFIWIHHVQLLQYHPKFLYHVMYFVSYWKTICVILCDVTEFRNVSVRSLSEFDIVHTVASWCFALNRLYTAYDNIFVKKNNHRKRTFLLFFTDDSMFHVKNGR